MDFGCGRQVNFSSGNRSINFRVSGACCSNSANIYSATFIWILLMIALLLVLSGSDCVAAGLRNLLHAGEKVVPSGLNVLEVLLRERSHSTVCELEPGYSALF